MTDLATTIDAMCPGIIGNPWIPEDHFPHPKQLIFLAAHRDAQRDDPGKVFECLFGGAAGGGKSDAMLMAAAQTAWLYPGSQSALLRLTHAELTKPGALLDRALSWWNHCPGVKWSSLESKFIFPNGSQVAMGYHSGSTRDDAQWHSAEFQLVGFDEATFWPTDHAYMHLKSRIRRLKKHIDCPMRLLASANPGGAGHQWVKNRFIGGQDPITGDRIEPVARFIPSKIADNPSLDQKAYWESLGDLHPTRMAQLRDGDWDARDPGDFFRREWFGPLLDPHRDVWPAQNCRRVRWWDLAASEKEDASQTAGCRMARHVRGGSAVEHMLAFRKHPGERDSAIVQMAKLDGPAVVQGFEVEPGSGGQAQVMSLVERLKREVGCQVAHARPKPEMNRADQKILVTNPEHLKGKIGRLIPVSASVYRGYVRRGEGPDPGDDPDYGVDRGRGLSDHRFGIRVFAGPWTEAFLDQGDEFPVLQPGTQKVLRCDQLEAMGGAWRWLNAHPIGGPLPGRKKKELPSGNLADIHPEDRPDPQDLRKDKHGRWLP